MIDPDGKIPSERALIICFLVLISAVLVIQVVRELGHNESIQFTEVFHMRLTSENLRDYEKNLEAKSWFPNQFRPLAQAFLFWVFGDAGPKGVRGREGWFFFRPDLRYVVEGDRPEEDRSDSKWWRPPDGVTRSQNVVRAIVRFHDRLNERGIKLLVVPIPGKPSIYPDKLTRRWAGGAVGFDSPTLELIRALRRQKVETMDLFSEFARARGSGMSSLYLRDDTHWTPLGARLAAETVAVKIRELGWAPPPSREFETQPVRVERFGDVLEMVQAPLASSAKLWETVVCEQVRDKASGLLVPSAAERPAAYRHPARNASILILGDSFCRIYQLPEPRSLGKIVENEGRGGRMAREVENTTAKRPIPGSAGFPSHLARAVGAPVDWIVSDGGASTDVRKRLQTYPEILEGKRLVIWEFVERDIALGKEGWLDVPLPEKLGSL